MVQSPHTQNCVNEGHIFTVCLWMGCPQVAQSKALSVIGVLFVAVAKALVDAVIRVERFPCAPPLIEGVLVGEVPAVKTSVHAATAI